MPKVVGVLTSSTGSVIKDIINVSTRRNPNVYIKLWPIPVQGEGAKEKIAEAIEKMNRNNLCDVIILARGGGSIEDLWPFNEEIVAHAIYESEIPIISAIGHETDFTIADFVADLRAPTPSAAAELAVPDINEIKLKLDSYVVRMKQTLVKKVQYMRLRYEKCISSRVFKNPLEKVQNYSMTLDIYVKDLRNLMLNRVKKARSDLAEVLAKLDALSPLNTLSRGYCIAQKENGDTITLASDIKKDDVFNVRFKDDKIKVKAV